jgi:D-alanyl-lipoteichoic acid acyltransferase DltB (MBOAT superfamily)
MPTFQVSTANGYMIWMTNLLFGLRIYYDFSGYSLVAYGIARCLGVRLTLNFVSPYCSTSIQEFWRRWHVTLSNWFRDYLYIPLGGNRVGPIRRNFNLFFTFLMSGFWHGANWTYIAWGGLHGMYVVIYTNLEILVKKLSGGHQASDGNPRRDGIAIAGRIFGTLLTFTLCVIGLVFFRSGSIGEALHFFHYVITPTSQSFFDLPIIKDVHLGVSWYVFVFLLFGFVLVSEEVMVGNDNKFTRYALPDSIWLGLVFFLVLTMGVFNQDTFIYFQF